MKRNTQNNGQLPIIDWQFNRIAVKIGSNVLTRKDGTLDITRMSALVDQVAKLHRKGVEVVLISSGAVASGRSEIKASKKLDPVSARQLYSAVGQAKLINRYYELFREHGMTCGQVLTTKENFGSRTHYLNQKHCMEVMLENKVIPIVNENDTISVTELMFTDNDELSGLIATMMGMDALIILSNIDGIYNGNPSDPSSTVIREIDGSKEDLSEYVQTSKSSFGRGGMLTKCSIAQKVADEGITVIIANGKKDNILVDLLAKDSRTVCTRFIPSNKPVSSVKKWIAHSEGFAKGEIHINRGAEEALLGPKATSILLVGVTRIIGDFEKDDIVKVINEEGVQLGVGCAGYDSTEARELIGSRDKNRWYITIICIWINNNEHTTMINELLQHTLAASRQLVTLDDATINRILIDTASALLTRQAEVLAANVEDLSRMDPANPKYDRLKLTEERLAGIAGDMKNVASLPSPLGKLLSEITRPNGMVIRKMTVPFGVIGVIYEARPNVTFDVFSLCFKSGNACVLKGGSDADSSNRALVAIIHDVLTRQGVDPAVCTLLPPDREATTELLNAVGLVDLIIPRGSSSLINYVRDHARVPVIETGAGICHTYFDKDGDKEKGREIVNNAKTRRVSVCNALDCLIVHRDRLGDLPYLCGKLSGSNVIIYADEPAFAALSGHYPTALLQPATADSFGTEFLDYKMAIRTVSSLDEALQHIARYSSKHSESIVSESTEAIRRFQQMVDAACVYANVSTAFTDGAQFGFGAEIGISTQKLHARGPMALPELTTYKYIIEGDGQIRK